MASFTDPSAAVPRARAKGLVRLPGTGGGGAVVGVAGFGGFLPDVLVAGFLAGFFTCFGGAGESSTCNGFGLSSGRPMLAATGSIVSVGGRDPLRAKPIVVGPFFGPPAP